MKIGVSTASFFPRYLTEETIEQIDLLGAEVCEVFLATHSEYTQAFTNVLKKEFDRHSSVKVNSVHALTNQFEPELFGRGTRAYEDAMKVFKNVLGVGKGIGASYYTFHGATLLKPAVKYVFDFEHIGKRLNILVDTALEYGIKFTYENVHWAYFKTPEYFQEIIKVCPRIMATLDIKQAMQAGVDYNKYIDVMKGRLATVHLCGYNENKKLFLPNAKENIVDFVQLFKRLRDVGFDGNCLVEVYTADYSDVSELKGVMDYLKDCLYKAR